MKKNTLVIFAAIIALVCSGCSAPAPATREEVLLSPPSASSAAPAAPAAEAPAEGAASPSYAGDNAGYVERDFALSDSESYLAIEENREKLAETESMLTFSLKVDTASYTNVRRYIESGNLPPKDAVRTEELINYFNYDEKLSFAGEPFAIYTEVGPSPFSGDRQMAFIRVKTQEIDKEELPDSNLTFLIDTSGSMNSYDKLPLLKEAFSLLVETLDEDDKVSIVTYAGSSGVALDSVSGADKQKILNAINNLEAGGSTAGADGINTAYRLAEKNFKKGGNNRVILATDGDFNVGVSSISGLEKLISKKRDSGVYLSILGFGTGNLHDSTMETLSKNGNGNYSYIDSVNTAKKVLVDELASNLFTVADDVKAQVEFNPANVKSYRLIGYENRALNNRDFEDDTKDAGEIGAGTDVVIMFELELADASRNGLKYASSEANGQTGEKYANELFEVRIRYKDPGKSASKLVTKPVTVGDIVQTGSSDYRFAAAVTAFGHLLRNSEYTGDVTIEDVISIAKNSLGEDKNGYRRDCVSLLRDYQNIVE